MTKQADTQSVTDLLRQQHAEVKTMFAELQQATDGHRRQLFDCLRATLAVHETAEEAIVHPAARKASDYGNRVVEARLREEQQAKESLAELEKMDVSTPAFETKFRMFERAVVDHAEAEERELFPLLEVSTDHATLVEMASRFRRAEQMAPTHPHPHGPDSPAGIFTVGTFAAMVDKVRDKMSSRD